MRRGHALSASSTRRSCPACRHASMARSPTSSTTRPKWSPPGASIDVRLRNGELAVRDRGPGIAAEDLPFVFDRFYRAPGARGRPGSGLGLAIVRQVAEAHGGGVQAGGTPGGGAPLLLGPPGAPLPAPFTSPQTPLPRRFAPARP